VQTITLAMAALLMIPTVVLAQTDDSTATRDQSFDLNLDNKSHEALTSDQHQIDQIDESLTDDRGLETVEKPTDSADPVLIAPKFDFGDKLPLETDASAKPYLPEEETTPGLVIKIPTN